MRNNFFGVYKYNFGVIAQVPVPVRQKYLLKLFPMHGMVGSTARLEFEFLKLTCGTPAVKVKSEFGSTAG